MNRKGFTIIELIVAFAVIALISAIAVVSYNGIFDQTKEKYYQTLENNLKLSGNNYFTEHRDRLPINTYNSISVKELIDNNYIEPLKDADGNMCTEGDVYVYKGEKNNFEYEVCLRCGNYESVGKYCGITQEELENKKLVRIPTSSLCKRKIETTYTGSALNLVENIDSNEHFTLLNTSYIEANENGYRITARLKSGYTWSDNTQEDKYFLCNLYKRTPEVTISPREGVVMLNKTGSFEEEANVTGSFRNTLEGNNATISYNNGVLNHGIKNTVTISGTSEGKTRIIIEFIPTDTKNYNSLTIEKGALVYKLEVTKGLLKPTEETYCKNNLVYNGNEQVLTIDAPEEFEFQNNRKTNAGSYEVIAKLINGNKWIDGTTEDVKINCSIEKKEATITLSEDMLEVVKDGTITFTEKSDVIGTFSNIISDTTKANIEPMINSNVGANTPKDVTITGKNATEGTINVTVNFVPTGTSVTNYKETSKTIQLKVLKKATIPSVSEACKDITYDGTSQLLTNNAGTGYIYSNNYGKNAGDYTVKLTLQSGYRWEDNTTVTKTITCSIKKKTPTITLNEEELKVVEGKTITFTEKADIGGSFTNTINNIGIATVSPSANSNVGANVEKIETVSGINNGVTTIEVVFTPSDITNYENTSKTINVEILKRAEIPTNSLCKSKANATYTGSKITLVTSTSGTGYTLSNYEKTNANETGYIVEANLQSGYRWSDNQEGKKTFVCKLYKADAVITLGTSSGKVANGNTITFTEQANTKGTFVNTSKNTNIVTVTPTTSNVINANTDNNVTLNGKAVGTTTVEVTFVPDDTNNYNNTTTNKQIYNIEVTNGIVKPTAANNCRDVTYNGEEQLLTDSVTGYSFTGNRKTNAGSYEVVAKLDDNQMWSDNTTNDVTITCTISKREVTIPSSPTDKTYNGVSQNHGITTPLYSQINNSTSTLSATNVGTYNVCYNLTDKSNNVWSNNSTNEQCVEWKIVKSETITTLSNISNTYNGENQNGSGAASKLSSNNMTISGGGYTYKYYSNSSCTTGETTKSPKNAGTYYVKATLSGTNNYMSSTSNCATYTMYKKNAVIYAAPASMTLMKGTSAKITYILSGEGNLTCTSSDESKVKCQNDNPTSLNGTITVTPLAPTTSDVILTLSSTEAGNYNNPEEVNVTVRVNDKSNYQVSINSAGNLVYNGNNQTLIGTASVNPSATIYYSIGTELTANNYSTVGSTTKPQKVDAGSYIVYYYIPETSTYNAKNGSVICEIIQADPTCPTISDKMVEYTGSAQSINVIGGANGNIMYSTQSSDGPWSSFEPSISNVGTLTIYVKMAGNTNYNDRYCGSRMVTVNSRSITVKATNQSKTYDGTRLYADNTCDITSGTLATGHSINCSCSGSQLDVGSSTKTCIVTVINGSTNVTSNYSITNTSGKITVNSNSCDAGEYLDESTYRCYPCPGNTYSNGGEVTSCTPCPENSTVNSTHTSCSCNPGYHAYKRICVLDATSCPAGYYLKNKECNACTGNTYSNGGEVTSCTPCPENSTANSTHTACLCNANHYLNTSTNQCIQCPTGMYSEDGWNYCSCEFDKGYYWTDSSHTACMTCIGEDRYVNYADNDGGQCFLCGTNQHVENGNTCMCNVDYYWNGYQCTHCPSNMTSPANSNSCVCKPNYTWDETIYNCTCTGNDRYEQNGQCIICGEGYHSNGSSCVADVTSCPAGQYLSNGVCVDCPQNTYSNGGAVTQCTPCPDGSWSNAGSSSCECSDDNLEDDVTYYWSDNRCASCSWQTTGSYYHYTTDECASLATPASLIPDKIVRGETYTTCSRGYESRHRVATCLFNESGTLEGCAYGGYCDNLPPEVGCEEQLLYCEQENTICDGQIGLSCVTCTLQDIGTYYATLTTHSYVCQ